MSLPINRNRSQTIAEAWTAEGEGRGRVAEARVLLRDMLEQSFRALPEQVIQQINAVTDLERLRAATFKAAKMQSLDELHL